MAQRKNKAIIQSASSGNKKNESGKVDKKRFSTTARRAVLLGIISFLVYANTLKNGYAFDDVTVITGNTIVSQGIAAIPEIFATPYHQGWFLTTNDLYRPLSLAMFAAEYQLFDKSPAAGHFFNIVLFAGCVISLFYFLDQLFERKKTGVAFIASLLFALHPVNTEVVANIKSRDQILCFLFGFLALNMFIKYVRSAKTSWLLAGAFLFLLSLLSKETTITFLAVIPLVFFFYINENKRRSIYIAVSSVAAIIVFLMIRYAVFNANHAENGHEYNFMDNVLVHAPSVIYRLGTATFELGKYITLLFIPYPLVCDYSYNSIPFVDFSNGWVLLSLAAYLFLFVFSIYRFIKIRKDPWAFSILFYLITLSVCSYLFFLIGAFMGERFLFFPAVGFCLAIALFIEKLVTRPRNTKTEVLINKRAAWIIIPIGLVYAIVTIGRNNEWQDNRTLFVSDVKKVPDNSRLNYFAGVATKLAIKKTNNRDEQIQLEDEALAYFKKALTIHPQYDDAMTAMSGLFFDEQQYADALALCKMALAINPNLADRYNNVGLCYFHLGNYDSAIHYLHIARYVDPLLANSYKNLALVYKTTGHADSASIYEAAARKYKPAFKFDN